jgi:hypothetical protein
LFVGMAQAANAQDSSVNRTAAKHSTVKPTRVAGLAKRQMVNRAAPATITTGTAARMRAPNDNRLSYIDAIQRQRHEWHDCAWWKRHFTTIVFVSGGYYYWDAGYWWPAWGYNPLYNYYDYDGPIYTYGNLLPDQVILNVQRALEQLGYYSGGLTGSLNRATRQALACYQRDAGLCVTGVIDAATVQALGLE